MKKQLLLVVVVFLFNSYRSVAQRDSIVTLPTITVTSPSDIGSKVNNAFIEAFPEATEVQWYKVDKNYLAKFISEDMDHNALFKKNGVLKYDISFGYAENLPDNIMESIRSAYPNYDITRAFRVREAGREIWVVNLEGRKNYVIARVENNEVEEVQTFDKS